MVDSNTKVCLISIIEIEIYKNRYPRRSSKTQSVKLKPSGSLLTPYITRNLLIISSSEKYKNIKYSNCSANF